jgi:hypothetical protein
VAGLWSQRICIFVGAWFGGLAGLTLGWMLRPSVELDMASKHVKSPACLAGRRHPFSGRKEGWCHLHQSVAAVYFWVRCLVGNSAWLP